MGSTSMGATAVSSSPAVAPIEWGAVAPSPDLRAAIETDRPSAEIVDPMGKAPPS